MTYSCSDFLDSIMTALGVTGDDDGPDDQVAEIADKCLAEIARLQAIAGPVGASRRQKAQAAEKLLRTARDLLVEAGASRAVDRVRAAIRSANGAVRAADHRDFDEQREPPTPNPA